FEGGFPDLADAAAPPELDAAGAAQVDGYGRLGAGDDAFAGAGDGDGEDRLRPGDAGVRELVVLEGYALFAVEVGVGSSVAGVEAGLVGLDDDQVLVVPEDAEAGA